ncbi:MAG TPA: 23S rRNA (adenine(2030)-N(6))-methyltransferase RlmJ [Opitutaceae bacterium]
MNYRHHFHAGNFADVLKHTLLGALVAGLQRKEKGFVYIDTHAGRGAYDLTAARRGDSLERKPEWPDGIGRVWSVPGKPDTPSQVSEYVARVRAFDRGRGNTEAAPRHYPGSPWLVRSQLRPHDRMVLCEKHPEEHAALAAEFARMRRVTIQEADGYAALRGLLPPRERRALVLIDPPFENQNEYAQIAAALADGLKRLPAGTFAVWYPLTERARVEAFFGKVIRLEPPPTWTAELTIAGEAAAIKLRGCGLLVVNPPWQLDREIIPALHWLAAPLAQAEGASGELRWLVPER